MARPWLGLCSVCGVSRQLPDRCLWCEEQESDGGRVMASPDEAMYAYTALLALFPHDGAVRKDERRRYREFAYPSRHRTSHPQNWLGWYEDGIQRLKAAMEGES